MQQRTKQIALGLALVLSTSFTYAADPSFFNNTAPTSKSSGSGFPTPNVMSSSDFSSRVQSLNQETKSRLSQEATGLIPKPSTDTPTTPTFAQPVTPSPTTTTTTGGQSGSTFTGFGTGNNNSAPASTNSKLKPTAPAKSGGGFQIQY